MINDIKPIKVDNLNCFDNNIIADISRFYNRNYIISLLGEFDFTYRSLSSVENLLDYNDIFTGDILYVPYLLSELVGISLKHIEFKGRYLYNSFIKTVSNYLSCGMPVGISIDSCYVPWIIQKNILHRTHYFLIIGINMSENIFYCLDSYSSSQIVKISISIVYSKCEKLIIIDNVEKETVLTVNRIIEKLIMCLSNSGKSRNCDIIREFSQSLVNLRLKTDERVKFSILETSNFLFRLKDVADSRYNFFQGLTYLKQRFDIKNMDGVLEKAFIVYKDWEIVRSIIVKGYISGRVTEALKRTSNILNIIAANEEKVLKSLIF